MRILEARREKLLPKSIAAALLTAGPEMSNGSLPSRGRRASRVRTHKLAPAAARSAAFQRRSTRAREVLPTTIVPQVIPPPELEQPNLMAHNGQIVETAWTRATGDLHTHLTTEIDSPSLYYAFCCFVFNAFLPFLFVLSLRSRICNSFPLFAHITQNTFQ
jgi:hypothetical protein